MKKLNIGVALSGGVDSTSTAIMLREEYNVTGFFMQLAQPDIDKQINQVTEIAEKLNIPIIIIDLRRQFDELVLRYFCNSYYKGLTPNPCMRCNKEIKFGLFLDAIMNHGMDKAATGHYATVYSRNGKYFLAKGKDRRKDQSYFLSRLTQKQLSKILFPLGIMEKEEIYNFIEQQGFPSFRGKESQDVCFLENSSSADFLHQNHKGPTLSGPIMDTKGRELGRHNGIFNYTIGQRRGLGLSAPAPYYVVRIDALSNTVIVGSNEELHRTYIQLDDLHWISGHPPNLSRKFSVKIRYSHMGSDALLSPSAGNRISLHFKEPQRAVTPGQFCVIYDGDNVIGSGVIL